MDVKEYFEKINNESQAIFLRSIEEKSLLGELHHRSSCIYELAQKVSDSQEKKILETVSAQLESSTYCLVSGLYRQSFSSLRLALEMGLGCIFFSAYKIELNEWIEGRADIKWSRLIDENDGVLSRRFTKAFFEDLGENVSSYRERAIVTYRSLSEYVHGNNDTWGESKIKINYNKNLIEKYRFVFNETTEIILFACICRYIKTIDDYSRESLQFISEDFGHIVGIRNFLGQS